MKTATYALAMIKTHDEDSLAGPCLTRLMIVSTSPVEINIPRTMEDSLLYHARPIGARLDGDRTDIVPTRSPSEPILQSIYHSYRVNVPSIQGLPSCTTMAT